MKDSATVKIFLVDGDPALIRTAEISNWTGKAVAGPRSQFEIILARDEAEKAGIYFLTGINPETGKERVYVGEAEVIRSRIKNHLGMEFWRTVVFFVSKDENLTKAHIKYLEGKLIDLAKNADRFELENVNSSGSHLPESDAADMDVFLRKVAQLLPVLGQEFLKPVSKLPTGEDKAEDLFHCDIKGLRATGRQTEKGFLVLKHSKAVKEERPSTKYHPYAATLRSQLKTDGILLEENKHLVFAKDYEFSSPSAAAAVVHGGNANGLQAWKDDTGVTLKDREENELGA